MKKVKCLLIIVILLISALLFFSNKVEAAETYELYVNGEQFTSEHLTITCGEGTAEYDPSLDLLTLTNAILDKNYDSQWGIIYSYLNKLTIKLVGDNVIDGANNLDGIDGDKNTNITIIGPGTLTMNNVYYGTYIGDYTDGEKDDLIIQDATVTVNGAVCAGIWVNHNITFLNSNVSVTKTNNSFNGIVSNIGGTIAINNSNVTVSNVTNAIHFGNTDGSNHHLIINSGLLKVVSTNGLGIKIEPDVTTGNINGDITINDGTLDVTSSKGGTNVPEESVILGDKMYYDKGTKLSDSGNVVITKFVIKPILIFDTLSVDFGNVGVNPSRKMYKYVTFTNSGEVPVTLKLKNDMEHGPFGNGDIDSNTVVNPGEQYTLQLVLHTSSGFIGVAGDYNGTYVLTATSTEDSSATAVAEISAHVKMVNQKGYIVKFHYPDGDIVDDICVLENNTVTFPKNPQFGDKVIDKWYLDSEFKTAFDESTLVTSDLDLYTSNKSDVIIYSNNPYGGKVYTGGNPAYANSEVHMSWDYDPESIGGFKPLAINGFVFKEWRLGSIDGPVVTTDSTQDVYYNETTQEVYYKLNKSYVIYAIFEDDGAVLTPGVSYRVKILNEGWHDWVQDGASAMRDNAGNLQQAMEIKIDNQTYPGSIEYAVHLENVGWMPVVKDGELAGIENTKLRTEALKINLTGEMAEKYDVYYRTHVESNGWMSWAKNGEASGSSGAGLRIEGIQIKIVKKGDPEPAYDVTPDKSYPFHEQVNVIYMGHIENKGDVGTNYLIRNGRILGFEKQHLRMEGITIISEATTPGLIEYTTHVQNVGWLDETDGRWNTSGEFSGRKGLGLRVEGIKIRLTEDLATKFNVFYCVRVEDEPGWQGWAKNGEEAGSMGFGKKLEAIKIVILPKGDPNEGKYLPVPSPMLKPDLIVSK